MKKWKINSYEYIISVLMKDYYPNGLTMKQLHEKANKFLTDANIIVLLQEGIIKYRFDEASNEFMVSPIRRRKKELNGK